MVLHPLWRPFSPDSNAARQAERVAFRQTEPGPLQEHDPGWASAYLVVRAAVRAALGDDCRIAHVGSTAVPGMLAKPIVDVDLVVPDVLDEGAWLPGLEAVGFRLLFRDELGGSPHRQLTFTEPNANLHVFPPDAVEPRRHRVFVDWLRAHPSDRSAYAAAKRAAADGAGVLRYNDAKAAVVYDVYERVFAADPAHQHDPQPRG
ncbi:GrpB family protein [Curtobacterium sp. VKM Ac-2922]|uniref:GrpB family protein n=1 Tax=Curtobacterium sp. VKM Ac-2922 TaxID=2929475 RepID=UPI001FB4370A|nr:GrpB family protein [Curtobacterium sp. VKM Ac-2922]MCJ1714651.1 GrpB family protein [Curtobacterium sp. VKM Ac-2922]